MQDFNFVMMPLSFSLRLAVSPFLMRLQSPQLESPHTGLGRILVPEAFDPCFDGSEWQEEGGWVIGGILALEWKSGCAQPLAPCPDMH